MEKFFHGLKLTGIKDDLARNIVSLRHSENLFDDLSDNPDDWNIAIRWEQTSKSPRFTSSQPVIDRPFEQAEWDSAIGYPFTHWMESRFSNGNFGVWYGATNIETTVYETAYHWIKKLLADAGFVHNDVRIQRKVYWVKCQAALIDLRAAVQDYPALIDPENYAFTQQIGARLHRERHPGWITRSARCDGDAVGILNASLLSEPRQACFLTYIIDGDKIRIEKQKGKKWMSINNPAQL
jgi:hypothetical protein